jgi:hypothetical protein
MRAISRQPCDRVSETLAKAHDFPNNPPDYWATATFLNDLPAINFRLSAASLDRLEAVGHSLYVVHLN